jgi:hypothetical protein
MIPLGMFQLVLVALEAVACAVNPKLRNQEKGRAIGFGLAYVTILLSGIALVIWTLWSLYFRK